MISIEDSRMLSLVANRASVMHMAGSDTVLIDGREATKGETDALGRLLEDQLVFFEAYLSPTELEELEDQGQLCVDNVFIRVTDFGRRLANS